MVLSLQDATLHISFTPISTYYIRSTGESDSVTISAQKNQYIVSLVLTLRNNVHVQSFCFFCFFVNLLPSQLNSYFKFSSYHVTCNIFTLSGYNSSNQKTGDVSVELKCNTRTPTGT